MASGVITVHRVRELLSYDPITGQFYWKIRKLGTRRARVGTIMYCKNRQVVGYLKIGIDGIQYCAHRLAWLLMTGEWPVTEIDHINRNGLDNRWENLRLATPGQNRVNAMAQKSSKTGVRGVHYHGSGRYRVQLQKAGKSYHVGYFDTLDDARMAAGEASRQLHGKYAAV